MAAPALANRHEPADHINARTCFTAIFQATSGLRHAQRKGKQVSKKEDKSKFKVKKCGTNNPQYRAACRARNLMNCTCGFSAAHKGERTCKHCRMVWEKVQASERLTMPPPPPRKRDSAAPSWTTWTSCSSC